MKKLTTYERIIILLLLITMIGMGIGMYKVVDHINKFTAEIPELIILPTEVEGPEEAIEPEVALESTGRYTQLAEQITAEEKALTALVVYHESRGEPIEGQMAVAEVVFNRTLSEYDGATSIYDVIYADGQFSCADALTSVAIREPKCLTTAYEVVDTVLASTTYVVPEDYMYFSTSQPRTSDFKQIGHHYFR